MAGPGRLLQLGKKTGLVRQFQSIRQLHADNHRNNPLDRRLLRAVRILDSLFNHVMKKGDVPGKLLDS